MRSVVQVHPDPPRTMRNAKFVMRNESSLKIAQEKKEHIRIQKGEVKLSRAQGGCPGVFGRRRARKAAKSHDEPQAGRDSWVPEWGNPAEEIPSPERELTR